ncbi:DUF4177 domain-containing protein [Dyella sp. A6]|uniref:DUF4177 domain-containing protein n=1 Tax=Dyella aluminiiresistens TaxID=3069105 RepID=UPI002E77DD6B|nr:DUF4177 domain-containing protein [Dyella sp. A6]
MSTNWEYKVVTLKHGGMLSTTYTPDDDETVAMLNREGASGWELVSVICPAPTRPATFYLKRPR